MKTSKISWLVATIAAASITLAGCDRADYYSEVAADCVYDPNQPLTDACRDALQSVIPFDAESFESAPEGFMDRVMEAFRAVLTHPLALPPKNRTLGAESYSLPMTSVCAFSPLEFKDGCISGSEATTLPMQNAFNFLIRTLASVRYGASERDAIAHFGASLTGGEMSIYDSFWSADSSSTTARNSIIQAAALMHEARHADNGLHIPCTQDGVSNPKYRNGPEDLDCDADLGGAYGMNITYLVMALHGAARQPETPIYTRSALNAIAHVVCSYLSGRFNHLPEGVLAQLDLDDCGDATGAWILEKEGITVPELEN